MDNLKKENEENEKIILNDANEELNADEGDEEFEDYQREALNKNVIYTNSEFQKWNFWK